MDVEQYVAHIRDNYPMEVLEVYEFLKEHLQNNRVEFSQASDDGRLNSAIDEDTIVSSLLENFPDNVKKPKTRYWYDVSFETDQHTLVFNIKVSTGKTDNAMNKKAVVYSLTSLEKDAIKANMTYNDMFGLVADNMNEMRNTKKEYYYLYIDKLDGTVIIKSLLDIQNLVSNPCNILQINWTKEKKKAHIFNGIDTNAVKERLFGIISTSLKTQFESCTKFIEVNGD